MKHLDLFSGIGGFAIAAQACGYTTIGFCEREPYAQQILKERFGAVLADADERRSEQRNTEKRGLPKPYARNPRLHHDIFTLDGSEYAGVDLLTWGFPCQPFSVAGKRRGAEDDRAIWPEMLRVIREAKPTWIIGENVAGIVSMELDNILSDLEGIGYSAWPLVIPACAVDARQRRDRVWIVAHADEPSSQGNKDTERGEQKRAYYHQHSGRQLEPAILRMADGIPEGLDGGARFCQWPEEDYATPIVTTGIKHQAHRLKGLGNSIVPQVAEEIIRAITNLR
jgi:DNA (cytosine-5)-methyltransferase 1